jgi:hypothetical protein
VTAKHLPSPPISTDWSIDRETVIEALSQLWPDADIAARLDGSLDHACHFNSLLGAPGLKSAYVLWFSALMPGQRFGIDP